jgi:hypothetical protein
MECSICYENFIQPSSNENYEELEKEFMINHNDDNYKDIKFCSLLLLPNRTPRYRCPNEKCYKYICDYCYENTINEKELFMCHYCRMNDYKTYVKVNVLRELQIKVLGEEGFRKWWKEQILDI